MLVLFPISVINLDTHVFTHAVNVARSMIMSHIIFYYLTEGIFLKFGIHFWWTIWLVWCVGFLKLRNFRKCIFYSTNCRKTCDVHFESVSICNLRNKTTISHCNSISYTVHSSALAQYFFKCCTKKKKEMCMYCKKIIKLWLCFTNLLSLSESKTETILIFHLDQRCVCSWSLGFVTVVYQKQSVRRFLAL